MTKSDYLSLAKSALSEKRFNHTLAVAKLAKELGERYGLDCDILETAAILHDITKEQDKSLQLQLIQNTDIIKCDIKTLSPNVYHSITAYIYAKDCLNIKEDEILNSILNHTTGAPAMSPYEKIIFVADTVSYDRTYEGAERLREMSFVDLDGVMLEILEFIITGLVKKREIITPKTIECYNSLVNRGDVYEEERKGENTAF